MARVRLLHPGFFDNERLGALPMAARLLFEGLWCFADREGRLEDRPEKLKAQIFPYDRVKVDDLLRQLADAGFIYRYSVGGDAFLQVCAFSKFQHPHPRETASQIPPACGEFTPTEPVMDSAERQGSGEATPRTDQGNALALSSRAVNGLSVNSNRLSVSSVNGTQASSTNAARAREPDGGARKKQGEKSLGGTNGELGRRPTANHSGARGEIRAGIGVDAWAKYDTPQPAGRTLSDVLGPGLGKPG